MIHFRFVNGAREGQRLSFGREPVRVGRSTKAELRFDEAEFAVVSAHHAQIVYDRGAYVLVDTGSTNGTLVNGHRITKRELHSGDRVRFGHPSGPELEVEIEATESTAGSDGASTLGSAWADTVPEAPPASAPVHDARHAEQLEKLLQQGVLDQSGIRLVDAAAKQVAERRAKGGGQRSGDTVIILAEAMNQASESVKRRTERKWGRVLAGVGVVALLVIGVLGGVVYYQQRQLGELVRAKTSIDHQIQALQVSMQTESDPATLAAMEEKLAALTGSAQSTLQELRSKDQARAAELTGGDELEREIRKILVKFNASTYAIPPIFRERLQFHINVLATSAGRRQLYGRMQRHWPMITKEFGALGLPEEMAYIAWVESGFDAAAQSPAGAAGLWQMTGTTAQSLGLVVGGGVDERLDPEKQTRAAASYLARLMSEFGEDSFMLVLASYNRGENGVRRALGQVAREAGGFRKDKRDFWHLYRLKLLPDETREYVPRVLAAAIVSANAQKYGLSP